MLDSYITDARLRDHEYVGLGIYLFGGSDTYIAYADGWIPGAVQTWYQSEKEPVVHVKHQGLFTLPRI